MGFSMCPGSYNPSEKGYLQPPRFVLDYPRLNRVTQNGDCELFQLPTQKSSGIDPDLAKLTFAFGQYVNGQTHAQEYESEASKIGYQQIHMLRTF